METEIADTLPPLPQLALAHAPANRRADVLALLALDMRLAGVLRQASEPLIRQVKLAWWRDVLRKDPADWPEGEPLLALIRAGSLDPAALAELVDGWEILLAEELDQRALDQFAAGRAAGWQSLAGEDRQPAGAAARQYALADLALNLANSEEAELARRAALADPAPVLPRSLRPLALLNGLTRRALVKGAASPMEGPGAAFAALRLGLLGR